MVQTLELYFSKLGFKDTDLTQIINSFTLKEFSKNDFVVEQGKVSRHIGFVKSGLFQYYVLKDGEEKTSYVNVPNTWFASLLSFIAEVPSQENIRALSDGSIYLLAKPALKKLVDEIPSFKNFYIGLLEQSICGIDASRHDLVVLTAEQRYEKMLRTEPRLLQQIPLQYLASMLGVTPRHLSRIRGSIK